MSKSNNISFLMEKLKHQEEEQIVKGMANAEFIISMAARLFMKGSIKNFESIVWNNLSKFNTINSQSSFDEFHSNLVDNVINQLKTHQGNRPVYGLATKPINTFLKSYIYIAGRPNKKISKKLTPFLHIPLDNLILTFFHNQARNECQKYISSTNTALNMTGIITKTQYYEWQKLFRALYPPKPIILDIFYRLYPSITVKNQPNAKSKSKQKSSTPTYFMVNANLQTQFLQVGAPWEFQIKGNQISLNMLPITARINSAGIKTDIILKNVSYPASFHRQKDKNIWINSARRLLGANATVQYKQLLTKLGVNPRQDTGPIPVNLNISSDLKFTYIV